MTTTDDTSFEPTDAEPTDTEPTDTELAVEAEAELVADQRERATIGPFSRLYRGLTTFDFVGRKRTWFAISALVIIAGMAALGIRGLNLGIDFKGGSSWTIPVNGVSQQQAVNAVSGILSSPTVEILGGAGGNPPEVQVQADLNNLSDTARNAVSNQVVVAMLKLAGLPNTPHNREQVSINYVGPTWGSQITQKALQALIAFFIAVVAYISIRFEPKMALAAFIAMLHDLAVTVGIYALFGFQVTPDTVIAVLTILGYSLYDTVVVFDRVRDNTKPFAASGRMTYSAMVNLSMNQTLARSINTSMVAILPVLAVLLVGAELLGAITLQSYGVALTVGLLSGAYSSIFIASPLLAILKEREHRYTAIRQRLLTRGDRAISYSAQDAARLSIAAPPTRASRSASPTAPATPPPANGGTPPAPSSPATSARAATSIPQQTAPAIAPRARKQKKR